jgi:hypothetical protein
MKGDNDCKPKKSKYKVELVPRTGVSAGGGVVADPSIDTESAVFTPSNFVESEQRECQTPCKDDVLAYKTGIKYGIYDKKILNGDDTDYTDTATGANRNSGILAVARLDANGPAAGTKDEFPPYVQMLKKRLGELYRIDSTYANPVRFVGEPVIIVVSGGELVAGMTPSLYGVECGEHTWKFKKKDNLSVFLALCDADTTVTKPIVTWKWDCINANTGVSIPPSGGDTFDVNNLSAGR